MSVCILIILQFKPYAEENPYPLITDCYTACGMQCGFLAGWFFERRFVNFSVEGTKLQKIIRFIVGIVILLSLYMLGSKIFGFMGNHMAHFVKYFLMFFIMLFVYPLIFSKIHNRKQKTE